MTQKREAGRKNPLLLRMPRGNETGGVIRLLCVQHAETVCAGALQELRRWKSKKKRFKGRGEAEFLYVSIVLQKESVDLFFGL